MQFPAFGHGAGGGIDFFPAVAFMQQYSSPGPIRFLGGCIDQCATPGDEGCDASYGCVGELHETDVMIAGAFVIAAAGQVIAADMPAPYPAPQPPASYYPAAAPFNWGGFYVGANGGYGFGTSSWSAPLYHSPGSVIAPAVATGSFSPRGFLAGGTLGLNLQNSAFVVGVRPTATGRTSTAVAPLRMPPVSDPAGGNLRNQERYFWHVARRLGYAFGRVLVYGTGGLAAAGVQVGFNRPHFDVATNFGWTAGAGIEVAFAEKWTAKVEYLYVNLGSMTCNTPANCGASVPVTVSLTENIVRAGINYKFGPW